MRQSTLDMELIWEHTPSDGCTFYCLERKTEKCVGYIEKVACSYHMYLTYKGYIGTALDFETAIELVHTLGSIEYRRRIMGY